MLQVPERMTRRRRCRGVVLDQIEGGLDERDVGDQQRAQFSGYNSKGLCWVDVTKESAQEGSVEEQETIRNLDPV